MAGISTIHYALPPHAYFWQWSDDGSAIDWFTGQTLAFSEEIFAILKSLAEEGGIPPLGSLLLLNAACATDTSQHTNIIDRFLDFHADQLASEYSEELAHALKASLSCIANLATEYRKTTRAKAELCHTLFSRQTWSHQGENARLIVEELKATPPSQWSQQESDQNLAQRFLRDISALIKATAGLESEDLEQLIRTGIEFPELGEASFENDLTTEAEDSRSLLEQLASAGEETSALANIAKQVIGLISLPQPATKDNELPIGGVSDIVNRGTPDRLLTSELAWGDTILATRLAQNEALYYHRETPPQHSASERIILMDHGLRYWGLSRLFALATHLGLKCHSASADHIVVKSHLSTAEHYEELTLDAVADVKAALSLLPVHLSFAPALRALSEDIAVSDSQAAISDVFLIATESSTSDSETEKALHQITSVVRHEGGRVFLTLIDDEGHLAVYEYRARGKLKLQEGMLDLDELLPTAKSERATPRKRASTTLTSTSLEKVTGSKFYNQYPPPLWFLSQPHHGSNFHPNGDTHECVGLDTLGHLMRWADFPDRAFELSEELPGRNHWLGQTDEGQFLVACSGSRAGESAQVFLIEENGHAKSLAIEKTKHAFPRHAVFQDDYVIFIYSDLAEAFSMQSGQRIATHESKDTHLPGQTVRVVDGEIAISAVAPSKSNTHQFFTGKEHLRDSSLGEVIVPIEIGLSEKSPLILIEQENHYIYNPKTLSWEYRQNRKINKIPQRAEFSATSQMRFANEGFITTATLGEITFSHDPRGIMHITLGAESWSLHTHVGKGSLWKSREPNEPRAASKDDFLRFFEKIRLSIIPRKKP